MELTTTKPTHSVSIIEDISTIGNNKTNIIFNLDTLKNRVGEKGLTIIYDKLIKQYTTSQNDVFADFEEPFLPICFNEIDKKNNEQKLSAIVFEKQSITSSISQPSPLEKLQHCLTKDESVYQHLSSNNISNKNNPYFIAAGIGVSMLILLFIAHKFNLLPTNFSHYFKNIMPQNLKS